MWNPEEVENSEVFSFRGFIFEPAAGNLFHQGKLVDLAPKVASCLAYLVRHHGRLVTKEELINEIWKDTFVEDNALSYSISQLRKALLALDPDAEFIKTVPRRGFRFIQSVQTLRPGVVLPFGEAHNYPTAASPAEAGESVAEPQVSTIHLVNAPQQAAVKPRRNSRTAAAGSLFALFLIASAAAVAVLGWRAFSPSASNNITSVAVLPFRSFSENAGDRELRLRIADSVITRLGNLSHVVVRPTNSVIRFADSTDDAVGLGKQLGVDAVLDGRLQSEGGKLRATVQLISVKTGDQMWSAKFDGTADRLIALQDQIAEGLLARLIELQPASGNPTLTKVSTTNAEAYDNYLRGRHFFDQRAGDFDGSLKKAGVYFEKALELDPTFSSATAELANVINLQTSSGTHKRDVGYPKARELALKALSEDPGLAEAHVALGWVYQKYDYNFVEAERSFKRAIELNPNCLLAHLWLNINYALQGDLVNARKFVESSLMIDPTNASAHNELMNILVRSGKCDEAMEYMPRALEFQSDPAVRSLSQGEYEALYRRFDTAIPLLEYGLKEREARGQKPARPYVVLGYAYAASGNRTKAIEVVEELESMKGIRNVGSGLVAAYAHLGNTQKMHRALDELHRSGDERLLQMKVDPRYDIIRNDPKFQEILRKVNLL
jgi:DNA-binding winged helix-turn-helix (wHTH) protein/TolB-like protein/Tfp pilus assembly protein PilF